MSAPRSDRSSLGESKGKGEDRPRTPGGLPEAPPCPFCEGTDTELMSAFGGHASISTYWCNACRSPFDFMRWGDSPPDRRDDSGG